VSAVTRIHQAVNSVFKDADGNLVEYFKDDEVKPEHVELLDSWGALEPLDGDEPAESKDQPQADPAGGTSAEPITGDYEASTAPLLQGEVERRVAAGRTVEVTGTGAGGNVLKDDLVKALVADDEAAKA
jgi:hypothetical protein